MSTMLLTTHSLLLSASNPHPATTLLKKHRTGFNGGGLLANFKEILERSVPTEFTFEGTSEPSEPPTSAAPSSRASSIIDVDLSSPPDTSGKKNETEDGVRPGGISDGEDDKGTTALTSAYTDNIAGKVSFSKKFAVTKPITVKVEKTRATKKKKATGNDLPDGTLFYFTNALVPHLRVKVAALPSHWAQHGTWASIWDPILVGDAAYLWKVQVLSRLAEDHPSRDIELQQGDVIHKLITARHQNWRGYFVDDALRVVKDWFKTAVNTDGQTMEQITAAKVEAVKYLLEPTAPDAENDVSRKFMWSDFGDTPSEFSGLFHSTLILYPLAHHLHLLHDYSSIELEEGANPEAVKLPTPLEVTSEGNAWPKGALILSCMAVRRALEQYETGEFVKAPDQFSATTWGRHTTRGEWGHGLLALVNQELNNQDWKELLDTADEYRKEYFTRSKKGRNAPPLHNQGKKQSSVLPEAPPAPPPVLSFKKRSEV